MAERNRMKEMPEKVARICKLYNVTEEEAEKMMADIDKRRMTNYRFYTDQKWGDGKELYIVTEQFRAWI